MQTLSSRHNRKHLCLGRGEKRGVSSARARVPGASRVIKHPRVLSTCQTSVCLAWNVFERRIDHRRRWLSTSRWTAVNEKPSRQPFRARVRGLVFIPQAPSWGAAVVCRRGHGEGSLHGEAHRSNMCVRTNRASAARTSDLRQPTANWCDTCIYPIGVTYSPIQTKVPGSSDFISKHDPFTTIHAPL